MIYLVYIIFGFTLVQFFTALANVIFRQKLKYKNANSNPLVSVLIPARNEEKNIGKILSDLQKQDYKNIEIIAFNDQSEDKTEEILNRFAEKDKRIKLINSTGLPEGWLGKNHACHNLATQAGGNYLLFLDADVRAKYDLISRTLAFSQFHNLSLLSIFPKQIMKTAGEKLTVPLMHYILLTLLPLILVRKSPFTSHSAANGQFMLFEAETYKKYFPHQFFKDKKVEDIVISRFLKSKNKKTACLSGTDKVSCRMYSGYPEAVEGFSKNIVMFFGGSYLLAFLFWFLITFGWIPVLLFSKSFFFVYLGFYSITILLSSAADRQSIVKNILFAVPQRIVMAIILIKSLNKTQKWKGRSV